MTETRQYQVRPLAKGTPCHQRKTQRSVKRRQIALRPSERMFENVNAWADEWGVSWNEAALRIMEDGLGQQ
jgi:hypothetical protein